MAVNTCANVDTQQNISSEFGRLVSMYANTVFIGEHCTPLNPNTFNKGKRTNLLVPCPPFEGTLVTQTETPV